MGGDQCTTPQRTAGSCQYIFARQCRPVLTAILTQGVTQQLISYLIQAIPPPVVSSDLTSPSVARTRTNLRLQPRHQQLRDQQPNDRQLSNQPRKQPQRHSKITAAQIPTTGSLAGQSPGREIGRGLWSLAPRTPSAIDFRFNAVARFLTRRRFSLQLTASTRLAGPMW